MIRLTHGNLIDRTLTSALLSGGLLLIIAIACGDDDSDATEDSASGSGGTAGSAAGTGGSAAGTGGESTVDEADQAKQETCQCYIDLEVIPQDDDMKAECVSRVSDACVACVEGITGGAGCSDRVEADLNPCVADCMDVIAAPETSVECKHMIDVFGESPVEESVTDCFCDNCLDVFGPCMVHRGCMRIILCMGERNCDTAECLVDEVCGPVFNDVETLYPGTLIDVMLPLSLCNNTYMCRPNPALVTDAGGTSDAGADADGG